MSLDSNINKVKIYGMSDLEWTDTKLDSGLKREIGRYTNYIMDGEIVLRKQQIPAKPVVSINESKSLNSKFLTMDIETVRVDKSQKPYLISAYNGSDYFTSYADKNMDNRKFNYLNPLLNKYLQNIILILKVKSEN